MIDRRLGQKAKERVWRVDPSMPQRMAPRIKLIGHLSFEQRFRVAIADLLTPVCSDGWPAMMPDQRRWAETQLIAVLQQTPANINIVRRFPEDGIEAADCQQRRFAERHVATGDVFSVLVIEHDLSGTSG